MKRVLIIDDDTTSLAAMHQMLKISYRVSLFIGGSGSFEALQKIRPDLLIVDRYMPGLSGVEICEWVKSPNSGLDIPVIIYSAAQADSEFEREALAAGAALALLKTTDGNELVTAIQSLIG